MGNESDLRYKLHWYIYIYIKPNPKAVVLS